MAKKKIIKHKDGKNVEIDQDAIEAALAGAVTSINGAPIAPIRKPAKPEPTDECTGKPDPVDDKAPVKAPSDPIATDQRKFGEDCYNFNIDAKKCHYQSTKHEDKSILEYVRAINKKIYDETCIGGFSTNVQFRVTPQDWVNVSHIKDWYRARGFEVEDKGTTSPAYGKEVGTMNYNFTISWANAK
jgi:hypothetical protein